MKLNLTLFLIGTTAIVSAQTRGARVRVLGREQQLLDDKSETKGGGKGMMGITTESPSSSPTPIGMGGSMNGMADAARSSSMGQGKKGIGKIPSDSPAPISSSETIAPVVSVLVAPVTTAPVAGAETLAPVIFVDTKAPAVAETQVPVTLETSTPVLAVTEAPYVAETEAPVVAVVPETDAPVVVVAETEAPVAIIIAATDAPVVLQTAAPVASTETTAPVSAETEAPVIPDTFAPATPDTTAPVVPVTPAPVVVLVNPTPAPVPVPATASPVIAATTPAPTRISSLLAAAAPDGGASWSDPTSYQSKALAFVEGVVSPATDLIAIQYYALACIFLATSGVPNVLTIDMFGDIELPTWISTSGWLTNSDYCGWYGITCAGSSVNKIVLISNRLFGSFPAEAAMLDGSLEYLDLYNNEYLFNNGPAGNDFLGDITSLKYLYYGTTGFSYIGLPSAIGKLTNLIEYDCSFSYYNGPIPDVFGNMKSLVYLDMGDQNWLGNGVPPSITSLPSLEFFYLDNAFIDPGLDFLIGMPKILEFWADSTDLASTIPSEIGALSTLNSLSLTKCGLTGSIPTEMGRLSLLDRLWLFQNELTGQIPTELGSLARIVFLYVEGNQLTGSMPTSICLNRQMGLLEELGADCNGKITCDTTCCTCCGEVNCGNSL